MRNFIRTIFAGAAATVGVLGFSSPASATVQLCFEVGNDTPKCGNTTVQVLVNQQTGDPVTASDNDSTTNINYNFTSTTETNLVQVASGQADVASADADGTLNQISFNILNGGSASLITFNLVPLGPRSPGTDAQSVTVSFLGIDGNLSTQIFNLSPNGNNFFGIEATAGEQLTGLAFGNFQPTGSGIQALNQVRLNLTQATPAVPEPGTWAMMLLGFAAVGSSLRRSRRSTLVQAA